MWDVAPPLNKLYGAISDPTNPIGMRMRAAYFLKQAYTDDPSNQEEIILYLSKGLADKRHGSLMRHEYAYVMGQLQDERCCQVLESILINDDDCSMVRHEAAEALAAVGSRDSKSIVQETMEKTKHNLPEIYETCLLALNVMDWRERGGEDGENSNSNNSNNNNSDKEEMPVACACTLNPYSSVDPAPPHPAHASKTMKELGDILCNSQLSIFDRYRAMFSLRNRGGEEAVVQLCRALTTDTSSALLRHEVSYVLGQMQHPASITALETSLRKQEEHQMVRHESAEALGAIEGCWGKVEAILEEFTHDKNQVVRESCLVALDAADYWGNNSNNSTNINTDADPAENHNQDEYNKKGTLSFVQQKALASDRKETQKVLNHHFNTNL